MGNTNVKVNKRSRYGVLITKDGNKLGKRKIDNILKNKVKIFFNKIKSGTKKVFDNINKDYGCYSSEEKLNFDKDEIKYANEQLNKRRISK